MSIKQLFIKIKHQLGVKKTVVLIVEDYMAKKNNDFL